MKVLHRLNTVTRAAASELFPSNLQLACRNGQLRNWHPDPSYIYCPRCGASAGPGAVTARGCSFCADRRLSWQRITRLKGYHGSMADWIRAMKFQGQWRWADWFGRRLAEAVGAPFDEHKVVVSAVPMHWRRRWRRGFDQAALMARALGRARGWPLAPVLTRSRHTPPQSTVVTSKRADNVRGSFHIEAVDLRGYELILVDDVKTSGATLSICARLLHRAGARSVHTAVAAVADPRGGN